MNSKAFQYEILLCIPSCVRGPEILDITLFCPRNGKIIIMPT